VGKFFVAVIGVVAGFVLAHVVNQTPEGRKFFADTKATLDSFVRGLSDSLDGSTGPKS
jgi:hypothetical protein